MNWDPRRPDFGGTVPILRAVFREPPGYMAGHTFVPLFEILDYINKQKPSFFCACCSDFSTYNLALILDITIVKNNITRMICCGFVVVSWKRSVGETIILLKILAQP
jgi:hypothetical protein